MRTPLRDLAVRQHGAFSTTQALSCYTEDEVRARIRTGRWIRVFTGAMRTAEAEPSARLRVAAAGLSLGHPVAACLHTAAELHRFGVVDDPVTHVLVSPNRPCVRRPTLWPHQLVLRPTDVERLACGTRATTPCRTAADLARTLPRLDALPVLDQALKAGVGHDAILAELQRHVGLRGVRQARDLVRLADPAPESTQESRLRLRCHDAGLPPPTPQLPVLDERGCPCRWLDLGWKRQRVGLEYDGEIGHDGAARRRADRRRHNWLEDRGWAMFYATDLDVYRDHDELMRKIAAALARRSRQDRG